MIDGKRTHSLSLIFPEHLKDFRNDMLFMELHVRELVGIVTCNRGSGVSLECKNTLLVNLFLVDINISIIFTWNILVSADMDVNFLSAFIGHPFIYMSLMIRNDIDTAKIECQF